MSLSLLHRALQSLCLEQTSITLCDHRGQVLATKNPHPFDLGTWSEAIRWALKYFPMNAGDVVIFNDPFSGGNDFSVYSFITCLQKQQDNKSGLLAGTRIETPLLLKDVLEPKKDIFRVPLTPIAMGGQIQNPILEAMSTAPGAPAGLKELVLTQVENFKRLQLRFEQIPPNLFLQKNLQKYIEETRKNSLEHLKERSWGENKVELTLDTGESIKLFLEISDNGIKLDFGGTSPGKAFFLPPGAVNGISAYYLSRYFELFPYMNEGLLSTFQVSQPATSCLSARFPQSTARGFKLGTRVLSTQLDLALQKIHSRPARGINNYCGMYVQMMFPDRPVFEVYLPNGLGAIAESEGSTGLDPFCENSYFSVEATENTWPLQALRTDVRNSTHGKGKVPGGRGLIHKFHALEGGEMYWLSELTQSRFHVQKNQTSPDKVEVLIDRAGETMTLPLTGHCEIKPQDHVIIASGSGGGLL